MLTTWSSASPSGEIIRSSGYPLTARGSGRVREPTATRRFNSAKPRRWGHPENGQGTPLAVMVVRSPDAVRAASVAQPTHVWCPQSPAINMQRGVHSSEQMIHPTACPVCTRNERYQRARSGVVSSQMRALRRHGVGGMGGGQRYQMDKKLGISPLLRWCNGLAPTRCPCT